MCCRCLFCCWFWTVVTPSVFACCPDEGFRLWMRSRMHMTLFGGCDVVKCSHVGAGFVQVLSLASRKKRDVDFRSSVASHCFCWYSLKPNENKCVAAFVWAFTVRTGVKKNFCSKLNILFNKFTFLQVFSFPFFFFGYII